MQMLQASLNLRGGLTEGRRLRTQEGVKEAHGIQPWACGLGADTEAAGKLEGMRGEVEGGTKKGVEERSQRFLRGCFRCAWATALVLWTGS